MVRGFWFEFGMIWEVAWVPRVLVWLKIGHCKTWNIVLAGQREKDDVTQQLQTKIF